MAKKKTKLGWHFLPQSMKLDYGDGRKAVVGQTLAVPATVTPYLCREGMHASESVADAANYEKGPVLTRVEVSGDLQIGSDKFCGRERKVLWAKEITTADANEIGKMLGDQDLIDYGGSNSGYGSVKYLLSQAAGTYDEFDDVMVNWAAKHGCPGITAKKLKPAKPRFGVKELLAQLDTHTVRTKYQILKAVGRSQYDMRSRDFDDAFDQAVDEAYGKVHVIENFTRNGASAYLRVSRK